MRHQVLRATLTAVLIGAAAVSTANAQDILVTAPRERVVDRADFGAEVVEYTASLVVDVRDLDLASAAGRNAMESRLIAASRAACNIIDERIPIDLRRDRRDCEKTAYRAALMRVGH